MKYFLASLTLIFISQTSLAVDPFIERVTNIAPSAVSENWENVQFCESDSLVLYYFSQTGRVYFENQGYVLPFALSSSGSMTLMGWDDSERALLNASPQSESAQDRMLQIYADGYKNFTMMYFYGLSTQDVNLHNWRALRSDMIINNEETAFTRQNALDELNSKEGLSEWFVDLSQLSIRIISVSANQITIEKTRSSFLAIPTLQVFNCSE